MGIPIDKENLDTIIGCIKGGLEIIMNGQARRVDVADNIKVYTIGENQIKIDIRR